jgi:hypothetical protein
VVGVGDVVGGLRKEKKRTKKKKKKGKWWWCQPSGVGKPKVSKQLT